MSEERETAIALAEEAGVAIDKRWNVEKIMAAIETAQGAEDGDFDPEETVADGPDAPPQEDLTRARMRAKEAGVDVQPDWSPEKINLVVDTALNPVTSIEAVQNKLGAYGVSEEEMPDDVEGCERLLEQVLKMRGREAEKRQKEALGDDYGKTAACRVLKAGDGKISTGVYLKGMGNMTYDKGDEFEAPLHAARSLEDRGLVEIVDA
ncbi:MAG: hypothetical protein AAGK02_04675 [Pseudomonadota bacterium]